MKRIACLFLALMVAFSMVACGGTNSSSIAPSADPAPSDSGSSTPAPADGVIEGVEPLTIVWGDYHATTTTFWENVEYWAELVDKKSGGAITVELYPAAQLGSQAELVDAVRSGDIHITYGGTGIFSNYVQDFQVTELPFIWDDYDHIERVLFEGEMGKDLEQKLLDATGLRITCWIHSGFRDMYTNGIAVNSMSDLKSVKMRSPQSEIYIALFNAIGAAATPLAWNDVYESVRSGVVDGFETTQEGFISNSLYEVAQNVIVTQHLYTAEAPVINEAFYQGLTEKQRQVIDESFAEMAAWFNPQQVEFTKNAFDRMENEFGCTMYYPDRQEFQDACQVVWEGFKTAVPDSEKLLTWVEEGRK